jgi:hypothetical protein
MMRYVRNLTARGFLGLTLTLIGCGKGLFVVQLAVNSTNPSSGVAIGVSRPDLDGQANGTTSFTRSYSNGAPVTLTAPASVGTSTFSGWSGCSSTSSTTCTVNLVESSSVTANYSLPVQTPAVAYQLTVNSINPSSGVSIAASPADRNGVTAGNSAFALTYNAGTQVTLVAPSTAGGNVFTSWSGCTSATLTTCVVAMGGNTAVTANYAAPSLAPPTYQLAVTATNAPSGVSIAASPVDTGGLSSGTPTFVRTYAAGTTVQLVAPSTAGGEPFLNWTGCTSASTVTCVVAMNSNATVTANYQPAASATPTYEIVVTSTNPSGGVAINASPGDNNKVSTGLTNLALNYNAGTTVTLTAPSSVNGNPFVSWSGCTASSAITCTLQVTANTTLTANYVLPPPTPATYRLAVNSSNPATGVSIAVSPIDNTNNSVGSTSFTRIYNGGTNVTLVAPATAGPNTFSSWSGCTAVNSTSCVVTLNANAAVTANYVTPPPTPPAVSTNQLTVNSTNPAQGVGITVSPADNKNASGGNSSFTRTYNTGTTITLTAQSTWGNNPFVNWSGCTNTSSTTCTVVLNADTAVTANYSLPAPVTHVLQVNSAAPASGVAISVVPGDNNNAANGTTSFSRIYNAGTAVTLSAPAKVNGYPFVAWSGCTSSNATTCNVAMNSDTTVTATYSTPTITAVTVSPNPASVLVGLTQLFTATVTGTGTFSQAVTWSLSGPTGASLGTLSSLGLFTTPSPAPATVTITATSVQDPTVSGSVTVTLIPASSATGPTLTVDAANRTRPISPYIYGMNAYLLDFSAAQAANIPLTRWGGDATSRYNYQNDATNTAQDYYFENRPGNTADGQDAVAGTSAFNALVAKNQAIGAATLGTVPVLGWVAKDSTSCSYPRSTYPNQYSFDIYFPCGDGENLDQSYITGNNPSVDSVAVGPSWAGAWVASLVSKFGTAANGGVGFYSLDNEPSWWDASQHDVHPVASTYDEVTNNGIATAAAIKAADPTAKVNGPVVDFWWNYFYSKKDIEAGWDSPPCYQPWDSSSDRNAHGGVPFMQYYLQQFAAYQATHNIRLLDYLDIHGYFSAYYPADSSNQTNLTTAGSVAEQQARVDSTRVLWDPTYTDPHYTQPNYKTDSNYYTKDCNVPLQAPQLIPMMQSWIAQSYPGTKTAISEYNWGAQESINGAVAQADVLGIFGKYGLDMATLWGPPNPITQLPGLQAFEIYRNYDGKKSTFGDEALASSSVDQGQLAVYGAQRTADGAITIVVINKTYGDLTSALSLANFTPTEGQTAQVFRYSNANLLAITPMPAVAITPPPSGSAASTITTTYPGQSITLIVVTTK